MKEKFVLFYPWLFGLLSGFVYVLAYSHSWNAKDFTTFLLVIAAAIAWSSLIFIKGGCKNGYLKAYIISSLVFSALYIEVIRFTPVDPVMHRMAWGLIVMAMILLNILLNILKKSKS